MIITTFLFVCSLFTSAPHQPLVPEVAPVVILIGDTLPKLEDVNNAAADIDAKSSSYKIVEKDESDNDQNVMVTGYYDKNVLKKMTVEYSNGGGKATFDYYYNKDGLFYVQRSMFLYGKPAQSSDEAVVAAQADRYYFYKGKMFAWIGPDKKPLSTGTKRFRKEEEMLNNQMEYGKQALKKQ